MVWLRLKWVKKKCHSLDYATGFSWNSFKKAFNEKSVTVEQSKHFHWWENKLGQFCVWPCNERQNDNPQRQAHKDSAHGSSEPCHLCTPWEQGMISLIAPERVGHSSKITMNGFCLVPGMHCQHYNDQHCGLISHQTFKGSLGGWGWWERVSQLGRLQLFPPHLCINKP